MAKLRQDTTDLAVFTFAQFNFQIGRMAALVANFDFVHFGKTFSQMDASFQAGQMGNIDLPLNRHIIGFGDLKLGMS